MIWFCWLVDPGRVGDLQDLGRGGSGEAFGVSAACGGEDCFTVGGLGGGESIMDFGWGV